MDAPAETFQHFLTQPVALARPEGRMIGRPVAFDRQDEAPRIGGIAHGEVDSEAGRTDLGFDLIAEALDRRGDIGLER